jgi:hypothetical protein
MDNKDHNTAAADLALTIHKAVEIATKHNNLHLTPGRVSKLAIPKVDINNKFLSNINGNSHTQVNSNNRCSNTR